MVRVHLYNPDSKILSPNQEMWLKFPDGTARQACPLQVRYVPKAVLLAVEGVQSRERAEDLRMAEICVPKSALPPADPGEFYWLDLIGLAVWSGDQKVGDVSDVVRYPSVDCLRVRCAGGYREVPVVEEWIEGVDLEAGTVRVRGWDQMPLERA